MAFYQFKSTIIGKTCHLPTPAIFQAHLPSMHPYQVKKREFSRKKPSLIIIFLLLMFPRTSLKFLLTAVTSAWARTNNVPDFFDYKCNFCIHCHNTMLGDQIETQLSQPPTPLLVPFLPFKHTVLYAVTLCCNIQSSHF